MHFPSYIRSFVRIAFHITASPSFILGFFALAFCSSMTAQWGSLSGSVSGTVTDATGAVVPGAHIQITTEDHSIDRNATAGADGDFAISGLPSQTYQLVITADGFDRYQNPSISVAVGRDTRINARLVPSHAHEQVVVHSETETIDTSQTSPVTNVDRDRIEELPIPSRNYLSFTLLSPSLGSANPAFAAVAPATAGEGGFSAGGLRPSSNALYIDGVDDNDEYTGLSRTELSPEAISDFQVVNHGYAAQSGGSAGGSVDVETRSGANLQHGDGFIFIQNGALNGTPALEFVPRRPDENRLRAGLSAGGAIRPNHLFYYLAGEQEMARGEEAGDFHPQLAAQIDNALQQSGPMRGFHIQQGFFPTTNQETELSGRIDDNIGASSLMVRYALTNNRSINDAFNADELSDASARGSAFYNDNSLNGAWSRTLSPRLVNQTSFEVAQRRADLRTSSASGPGIIVAGLAQFGTPFAGNTRRYETHVDASDTLIHQSGKHLLQAGFALSHVALRSADLDGFNGLYVFPDLAALSAAQPDFYIQSFGNPLTSFAELRTAAYVQDHWTPGKSLAIDYGLRYEFNQLPAGLPQHPLNVSPRVGIAWSPDHNWVVRGGFGIFFDRYLLSTLNRMEEFNGSRASHQIAEDAQAASFYRSGTTFTTPHSGIAPSIWQAQSNLANPYSETASLSVERALPAQWTVSGEYRYVGGVKLGRTINANLPAPVALTSTNAPSLGISSPTPQQLGSLVFPQTHLNPAYDAINQFQTEASSRYNGMTVTANRQFTEDLELMAGYTFSKTIDDASYDQEQPQNPYALGTERALSLNDQRHRFSLSGLWVFGPDLDDPQDAGKQGSANPFIRALYGLEFAPIFSVNSGFRNNPLIGVDSNREHVYPFATRPGGFSRNSLQTPTNVNFDLRILRMVPIWRGHLDIVAESFNLLNRQNVDLTNNYFGSAATAQSAFNRPIQEADPRRIQFSLDFEY